LLDEGKADVHLDADAVLCTAARFSGAEMLMFLAGRVKGMNPEARDEDCKGWRVILSERRDGPTEEMRECLKQMCDDGVKAWSRGSMP
jgi:hypothetical protein